MELRHLRYFVVVAEENLSRRTASTSGNRPWSTQIRDLGDELSARLFRAEQRK